LQRGRTLAGAACITPPSWGGRAAAPAVRPAIEALRAIHLYPHGVSAEDLAAICAQVSRNPLRGPAASTTPTSSLALASAVGIRRRAEAASH
jgi:hypothetical protein